MFHINIKPLVAIGALCFGIAAPFSTAQAKPVGKVVLHYVGPYRIPAVFGFQRNGNSYQTHAHIKVPFYPMHFHAKGVVQNNALVPQKYTDNRRGKLYAQAKFADTTVTFGKAKDPQQTEKKRGATFDAFSLTWHLALNQGVLPTGSFITNAKRIYPLSGVQQISDGQYLYKNKKIATKRYYVKRKGNKIEFAFAPSLNNIPVRVVYHNKGKTYVFRLKHVETNGTIMQASKQKI